MSKWLILKGVRHQVAIAGQVTDAQTSLPIRGALVRIAAAPEEFTHWLAVRSIQYGDRWAAMLERPDQTLTAADGHCHVSVHLPLIDITTNEAFRSSWHDSLNPFYWLLYSPGQNKT